MRLNTIRSEETDQLFQAILSLQSVEECYAFFSDLCTVKEMQSISLRLEVARKLREGATYLDIAEETGKSSAIITRIKQGMTYGNGGFELVLDRLRNERMGAS